MTKKTSKARTDAFFKALSDTGDKTIAAERACVSRSWVSLHRQTDPAFRARMAVVIAQAGARRAAHPFSHMVEKRGARYGCPAFAILPQLR